VQSLKKEEDSFKVLGSDSNAIVSHGKRPLIAPLCHGRDVYPGLSGVGSHFCI
jgi:hypothetical protein